MSDKKYCAKVTLTFETELHAAIFLDALFAMKKKLEDVGAKTTLGAIKELIDQVGENWIRS